MSDQPFNFEQAFSRLEEILNTMHAESVSLEASLKLYEEADLLIMGCTQRLTEIEKRIEILIKRRDGTLELDEKSEPKVEAFEKQD